MNKSLTSPMFKVSIKKIAGVLLLIAALSFPNNAAEAQDVANGKAIFEGQCTSCHAVHQKQIGPALKGVNERRPEEWLIKWIRNSAAVIESGDPYANKLYKEYNGLAMNTFLDLSDQDIKDVLAYIKEESAKEPVAAAGTATEDAGGEVAPGTVSNEGMSQQTMIIMLVLAFILLLASALLWRISGVLKKLVAAKDPEFAAEQDPSWIDTKFLPWVRGLNPTITALVVIGLGTVLVGGWYFEYANTEIGVQQGYAPTQPINFSHKIHAGDHKIDCQYCHSTADVSKQASVPPVSTCMNCHNYIDASAKYNGEVSPEIKKIRTAYENNTPIKWVRIHNLPDHAYFNHAQHVSIGKVECQTCHGPIETMEKVSQHASLQMGWCINCHRNEKVDVDNNEYYETLHEDLAKRGKRSITVAHNGGLECGKCHY